MRLGYAGCANPAALTPGELADLLHRAYRADHALGGPGLSPRQRVALADYLGCHAEARGAVWTAWCDTLQVLGHERGAAEYWLDAEFLPLHQERA